MGVFCTLVQRVPNDQYDSQWRKGPNKHYDEPTNSTAAPTYNREKFFDINGVTTINERRYDNQLRTIDGASTINGAASTISQLTNQGVSDVPKF